METPVRTTELEAINVMLSIMGNSPINSLATPYGVDVAQARSILTEVSKNVQAPGWHFNKRVNYTLSREVGTNKIPVASNIISIDADTDPSVDVVFVNGYLYDVKNNTDVFTHDVKCEVTFMFAFDELPEAARRYIMVKAARKLQVRFLGSENQEMFTRADEAEARVTFLRDEGESTDTNILNSPGQAYISRRSQHRRFGN